MVFSEAFDKASTIQILACDRKTRRVVVSIDGKLRLFDAVDKKFKGPDTAEPPAVGSRSAGLGRDGFLYYGSRKTLVCLNLANGEARKLGNAERAIDNVATGQDHTIYFSCGTDVYRLRIKS